MFWTKNSDKYFPNDEVESNSRLVSFSGLTVGLLCLIACPIFLTNDVFVLGWVLLPLSVIYFSVPIFNYKKKYTTARWVLYGTFNIGTFFYINLLGHGLGLEYLFVASIFLGLFLFRTLSKRVLATSVVIVLIIIGDFDVIPWINEIPLTDHSKFWIRAITLPGTLIIICGAILATYIRFDQRLAALNDIINIARTDDMTQLGNRFSFKQDQQNRLIEKLPESALVLFDLNGLKSVNDCFGHSEGDHLLQRFARDLETSFPDAHAYRFGGDEFVLWFSQPQQLEQALGDFSEHVANYSERYEGGVAYGVTYGREVDTVEQMIDRSDSRMYENKSKQTQ